MVTAALTRIEDINSARQKLKDANLSFIDSKWKKRFRSITRDHDGGVGDFLKSWDVYYAYDFISKNIKKVGEVVDLGCHKSELIPILNSAGYKNLIGVDLNEKTKFSIPAHEFTFKLGNFYNMPIESGSVDCVSAISVIEHGYGGESLFTEVARVLKPGGYFISSFDYWPNKVDVRGKEFFGLPWVIFDDSDVENMEVYALKNGMHKVIDGTSDIPKKTVINFDGYDYTFAICIYKRQ